MRGKLFVGLIVVGFGLLSASIPPATALVPDCNDRYCDSSFRVERVGNPDPVFTEDAKVYKVGNLTRSCNEVTCCNPSNCTFSFDEMDHKAGDWLSDSGSLLMTLPSGFTTSTWPHLLYDNDLNITVAAEVFNRTMAKCSEAGIEVGASYQRKWRSFGAKLICIEDGEDCEETEFEGLESFKYFVDAPAGEDTSVYFSGGCGNQDPNPCADPENNTCQ